MARHCCEMRVVLTYYTLLCIKKIVHITILTKTQTECQNRISVAVVVVGIARIAAGRNTVM